MAYGDNNLTRDDLQCLAEERLKDAKALLQAGCWSGAYYLAGYVIECALKAAIAKKTQKYDFPDKKDVTDSYTHALGKLLTLAGFTEQEVENDTSDWSMIKDWNESCRYRQYSKQEAEDYYNAVADGAKGVFQWLKARW